MFACLYSSAVMAEVPIDCDAAIAAGYLLEGDINEDCYVNFIDFAMFAEQWLDCIDPNLPCGELPVVQDCSYLVGIL